MKHLQLTVADRIALWMMLPQKGGKIKMLLTRDINERVEFTPEEVTRLELKDLGNGGYGWNIEKEYVLELAVSVEQVALVKECVAEADRLEKITLPMLPLVDKIEAL